MFFYFFFILVLNLWGLEIIKSMNFVDLYGLILGIYVCGLFFLCNVLMDSNNKYFYIYFMN